MPWCDKPAPVSTTPCMAEKAKKGFHTRDARDNIQPD